MARLAGVLAAIAVAFAAAFLVLRTPDTDRDAMLAKYGGERARFADGADGLRVHWRDEGCRDCPAIILLHGSSASLQTWEPLVQRLGPTHRIITLDLPGHGLTGPHPRDDYSAHGMFEAVDAVARAAGLDAFALGGNSMGGWVTWRYALENRDRVTALVLIDAAGMPAREGEARPPSNIGFRILRSPVGRFLGERITPRFLVRRSLEQTLFDKEQVTDAMVDRYWELLRYPGNRRATVLRATTPREPSLAERIGEIDKPVLVLWGKEDRLISVSAASTFKERLPQAEIVILDGVGHIPMEEAPDETAAAIGAFLTTAASGDVTKTAAP